MANDVCISLSLSLSHTHTHKQTRKGSCRPSLTVSITRLLFYITRTLQWHISLSLSLSLCFIYFSYTHLAHIHTWEIHFCPAKEETSVNTSKRRTEKRGNTWAILSLFHLSVHFQEKKTKKEGEGERERGERERQFREGK